MIGLESQKTLEVEPEIAETHADGVTLASRPVRDPLLLTIIGTALGLALFVLGTALIWGTSPILIQAPWYIPFISSFVALITLCISYLALGRYHVMRDSLSFWVGCGFAAYGIGQIIYALTWPGLLPNGAAILGHLANTPPWIAIVDLSILSVFLLAAILIPWPTTQHFMGLRWLWIVGLWLVLAAVGFGLLVYFESHLPLLVTPEGKFTQPQRIGIVVIMLLFVVGSLVSTLYYRRSGDKLAGYIALPQLALVSICLMVLIGGKRYDLWWYVQRAILVTGYLTVLFGLLSEYVRLLRREVEGTRLLEAILDNIPIGLAVTGGPPHYPISRVSRQGLAMTKRPPDQLIGIPTGQHQAGWKIFLPDGVTVPTPEQMPLYRASRFGEEVRNMELMMQPSEGLPIPILVNASPIRDAQGNVVAAVNTWLDITDRKRAEEILQQSEALYRSIARSIPNGGIFVVDRSLRYVIAEGSIVERFGLTREMLEGHTVFEVFDLATAAKMEARFRRVFAGETISYETEHNGRIYWTQHALLGDPLEQTIVITLDITERKQVEKALSDSEQRFRAIVNQATAGIIRSDEEGKSIFVNQAFCKMLGYKESELLGNTIWVYTHPDDLEKNRILFDRLMDKSIPFQLEKRFIRWDGSILWVNVSAAPIVDPVGRTQSVVSVVIDITERKRAEEDLQQLNLQLESRVVERTAELQTANKALEENRARLQVLSQRLVEVQEQERHALARELHDRVGQSLTALNLNLTIISDQLAHPVTSPVGNRLTDSIKLVTEMIDIVRDVMSDLRPVVLDEYGLVAALQSYIGKFQARYSIQVDFNQSQRSLPRLGAALEMTILRIAQEALLNIARHAQADHVTISVHCEQNSVLLTVQDNGIGIDAIEEDNRDGHGLVIMRERAEAVGGILRLSSPGGKGTLVEAMLPFYNSNKTNAGNEERE
ncbi:MAG TPA: PAS domain S-box protein [Anaerolineales bacterium]|nr:PAS domain S-box protein [Anaerolineales bacterium]